MNKKETFMNFLESIQSKQNSKIINTVKKGFYISQNNNSSPKQSLTEATDYVTVGSSPHDEDCAQVGDPDYRSKCKAELHEFKRQLIEEFGEPPAGATLKIKAFPHDFGTYHELVVVFNDDIDEAVDYAFDLEDHGITSWDETAKKNLGIL